MWSNNIPSMRNRLELTFGEVRVCKAAIVLLNFVQELLFDSFTWKNIRARVRVIVGLRECVDGLVVVWVILLLLGGVMPDLLCPSVQRSCPGTESFNHQVVLASAKFEEAALSPVVSPGVPHDPVFLAFVGLAPSHD